MIFTFITFKIFNPHQFMIPYSLQCCSNDAYDLAISFITSQNSMRQCFRCDFEQFLLDFSSGMHETIFGEAVHNLFKFIAFVCLLFLLTSLGTEISNVTITAKFDIGTIACEASWLEFAFVHIPITLLYYNPFASSRPTRLCFLEHREELFFCEGHSV